MDNVFDMTNTVAIGKVIYEKLKNGKYRSIENLDLSSAKIVTDKKLISKLDSILK